MSFVNWNIGEYMKILVVHNLHRTGSASGDDQVFKNEVNELKKYGCEVITYSVKNDSFDDQNVIGKLLTSFSMLWSIKHYRAIKKIIKDQNPDVMHVHTFFPLLSPSILYACKRAGVRLVATLHDTRLICPCATSLREGNVCSLCIDGKYFRMVRYNCFKGSRIMSFAVALIFKIHRILKTFYKKIDVYICLNDTQINLLTMAGYQKDKIKKKYNFVEDAALMESKEIYTLATMLPERFVVYYGRIGEEKGIITLLQAWENLDDIPLVIMGDGPLRSILDEWVAGRNNVYYLGYVKHDLCVSIVKKAEFVVFPSIWFEGCSMVQIESESLSKPIIATDIGYSSEAIIDNYNGYKFPIKDANCLSTIIQSLWNDPDKIKSLGTNARKEYEQKFTPEKSIDDLLEIYKNC